MTAPNPQFEFDGWVLSTLPRELTRHGQRVPLQDQPLQILELLLANPHQLVTREQLIAHLWPRGVVDYDGSLNTAVRKLRAALGDDPETPRYIETMPRQGYRFVGSLASAAPAAPAPAQLSQPPGRRPRAWWRWIGAAAIVLAVAGFFAHRAANAPQANPRLGVLPFENLSPDADVAFFTDGLHEEILTTLATRAPNLEVISRTTMMTYRNTHESIPQIAAKLGLTHVLEGSVRREGYALRLSIQLIDARTDTQIWSQNYDRELVGAMTVQSQVATEVASRLAVRLSSGGEQLPPSPNPQAFDLYLKARLTAKPFGGRTSQPRILQAKAWLDDALALDDAFAAALLERARMRLRLFVNSFDVSAENLGALRADLERARSLTGDIPQVTLLESQLAQLVDWDMDRATRLLQRAEVHSSRDVDVLMGRAELLATLGRPEDAVILYQQAGRLDPGNWGLIENWIAVLWNAHRPADALAVVRAHPGVPRPAFDFAFTGRTAQLDENANPVNPLIDPDSRLMARVNRFRLRGKLEDAIALLEHTDLTTMRQDSPSPVTIPAIGRKPVAELHGWAMQLAGDPAAAARDGEVIEQFVARERATRWNSWFLRVLSAEAALFRGDKTRAVAEIHAARQMVPPHLNVALDRYQAVTAAMIYAWAGAEDDALAALEKLATEYPGLGPAEIAREPLFTVPLARSSRFHALTVKLEEQIVVNGKLFDALADSLAEGKKGE